MYETIKNYINRYSWVWYLLMAGIACLCCWIIYGGGNDSDYNRTIEHLERVKREQRESFELNKDLTDSVERSTSLNREASERIDRAQEYQRQAITRIDESAKRIDEAAAILERNAELIEQVEQRHQTQSANGTTTTPPTKHVGAD